VVFFFMFRAERASAADSDDPPTDPGIRARGPLNPLSDPAESAALQGPVPPPERDTATNAGQ
jgi:hypothetical protein